MPASDDRRNHMLDLARRWLDSGVKARVFAEEHGVTPWTLYYWRERLPREERPMRRREKRSRRVNLARVHVVPGAASDGGGTLEIVLASGDRVRVSAAVSHETLRRVVQVLRA